MKTERIEYRVLVDGYGCGHFLGSGSDYQIVSGHAQRVHESNGQRVEIQSRTITTTEWRRENPS